jgi:hypothetical protein
MFETTKRSEWARVQEGNTDRIEKQEQDIKGNKATSLQHHKASIIPPTHPKPRD